MEKLNILNGIVPRYSIGPVQPYLVSPRVVPDANFEAGFVYPVATGFRTGYPAKYVGLLKGYYFLPP